MCDRYAPKTGIGLDVLRIREHVELAQRELRAGMKSLSAAFNVIDGMQSDVLQAFAINQVQGLHQFGQVSGEPRIK